MGGWRICAAALAFEVPVWPCLACSKRSQRSHSST